MNSSKPILAEQEDIYADFWRKQTVLQDKKRDEGLRIGVNSAMSFRTMFNKTNTRSLDLGNEQKQAVMQMPRDD